MEGSFSYLEKTKKYTKIYFFAIVSLIIIVSGVIAFNAAFSVEDIPINPEIADSDLKEVNPSFTLQHYFYFQDIDLSENNCNNTSSSLNVIDTSSNNGQKGGHLPTNGNETNKKCVLLEQVDSSSNRALQEGQYSIKSNKKLVRLFEDEKTDYQSNPRMKYMDRLYNNMEDYNKNYTLKEVWVLKDGKNSETDKNSSNTNDWDIYKVPTIEGGRHNPDSIMFTNNPNNNQISKKEDGTIPESSTGYTILIKEDSVIRLVYEPVETKEYEKKNVNFFDYNISDGYIYSTNNQNNPQSTSSQNDSSTWYAYTKESGINDPSNYKSNGDKYAFGNSNSGTNLGDIKHNSNYINRYDSNNKISGSSYGLVKNNQLSEDKTPIWSDGIVGPDLFGLNNDTKGKVNYINNEFSLIFDRNGGTFVLSDVVKQNPKNGEKSKLEDLENFKITYNSGSKIIYSNEFWPMDLADSWGTDGNDMKFGSGTNERKRQYFGAGNSSSPYLPKSDCGEDHNPYFGISFQSEFTIDPGYTAPLDFFFFGDDDFWLFIEDPEGNITQIADIGGVHSSVGQYVNLWDYVDPVPYKNDDGELNTSSETYKLYFFYTERGASGSTLYMRFTIPLDSVQSKEQETTSLIIGKEVRGLEINNESEYEFEITFKENEKENEDLYLYQVYNKTSDDIEDTNGELISSGVFKTDNHNFKLKNNQYLVILGLPDTIKFTVKEVTKELSDGTRPTENRKISVKTTHKEGYHDHVSEEQDGNEVNCSVAEVEYVQFFNSYTGIVVSKEAFGTKLKEQEFDFTVTLKDSTISGQYGDMEFKDGVATFKLKSGDSKKATNLPNDIEYTVTETTTGDFKTKTKETTGKTEYGKIDEISFYNYYDSDLKIEKNVIGQGHDEYKFTITFDTNENIAEESYNYTKYNSDGTTSEETISKTGGEITLKDDEYIIIKGLPDSTKYTIEEVDTQTSKTTYCKSKIDLSAQAEEESIPCSETTGKKLESETLEDNNYVKFTNYYGGLKVSKTVIGSESDKNKEFKFKVTLSDNTISGTYGDMEFKDGVAEFILKDNETKEANYLPEDTTYTITEESVEGYRTVKTGDTGSIVLGEVQLSKFYNYSIKEIKIEKQVIGTPKKQDKEYQFTISLYHIDPRIEKENYTYKIYNVNDTENAVSTGEFTNGYNNLTYEFSLKDNQYIIIEGLPADSEYEITEKDPDASKVYYSKGNISSELSSTTTLSNTIKDTILNNNYIKFVNSYAGLKVTKNVIGTNGDKNKEFIFNVILNDNKINGIYGDMTFKNGIATFTLKHGETKSAYGLPDNVSYVVKEVDTDNYSYTNENAEGILESGKTIESKFYNFINNRIKIEKVLMGTVADVDNNYEFTFEITNTQTGYPESYSYIKYSADNTIIDDTKTISSGSKFTLKAGEYIIIDNLPDNVKYKVTENTNTATKVSYYKGTIANGLEEEAEANTEASCDITKNNYLKFVNAYTSISIKKVVLGTPTDMSKKFNFTLTLDNTEINGRYGDLVFNNGKATFTLGNEEIKVASGLPVGINYTVTEENNTEFNVIKHNETGTLQLGETANVEFTNYITQNIKISKQVIGLPKDQNKEYQFRINFSNNKVGVKESYSYNRYDQNDHIIGEQGQLSDGDTFTLKANEYIILLDLEAETNVTIKEIDGDATKVIVESGLLGSTELITKETSKFEGQVPKINYVNFINSYGGISISKEIYNVTDDTDEEFTFTITLDDETINGEYGDLLFENGQAEFTLKHGETKYALGLPEGTNYEVNERKHNNYKNRSSNNSGTVKSGEQQEVLFTNFRVLDLRIEKSVSGLITSKDTDYEFNIYLYDMDNELYYKKYSYQKYNQDNELISEGHFAYGDNEFTLKANEYIIIEDLPEALNYSLTETPDKNSNTDYIIGTTTNGLIEETTLGTTYENNVSSINYVKFINKYASIKISKIVTGNAANYNRNYKFTIKLSDSTINGKYGDMKFKNGVATFTLKNNETKYVEALPENVTYEVTEEELADYKVTSTNAKGTTKYGEIEEVVYTNDKTVPSDILPPNSKVKQFFAKYSMIIITALVLSIGLVARSLRKKIQQTN